MIMDTKVYKLSSISEFKKYGAHMSMQDVSDALLNDLWEYHPESYYHSYNVQMYAQQFINSVDWGSIIPHSNVPSENAVISAGLHDIGKLLIPRSILSKPGIFNAEEKLIMDQHASAGYELLTAVKKYLPHLSDELDLCAYVALLHHDNVISDSYSKLSARADIQLCGRVVTVCDIYEALSAPRCYRDAMSSSQALEVLTTQFNDKLDVCVLTMFIDSLQTMSI